MFWSSSSLVLDCLSITHLLIQHTNDKQQTRGKFVLAHSVIIVVVKLLPVNDHNCINSIDHPRDIPQNRQQQAQEELTLYKDKNPTRSQSVNKQKQIKNRNFNWEINYDINSRCNIHA